MAAHWFVFSAGLWLWSEIPRQRYRGHDLHETMTLSLNHVRQMLYHQWVYWAYSQTWTKLNIYNITDRGEDLGLGDEAVRQLVVVVAVGGDDLRPGHLITSQLLVPQDRGQIPAKDGCQVAAPDLKGRRQVDWLHQDLLRWRCWRKAELGVKWRQVVVWWTCSYCRFMIYMA